MGNSLQPIPVVPRNHVRIASSDVALFKNQRRKNNTLYIIGHGHDVQEQSMNNKVAIPADSTVYFYCKKGSGVYVSLTDLIDSKVSLDVVEKATNYVDNHFIGNPKFKVKGKSLTAKQTVNMIANHLEFKSNCKFDLMVVEDDSILRLADIFDYLVKQNNFYNHIHIIACRP